MAQHLQIPVCGMDIKPPPHSSAKSGAHGQAEHGQGAAGHHAGLGLLSGYSCKQGLGGIVRSWEMSSGEFLRNPAFFSDGVAVVLLSLHAS